MQIKKSISLSGHKTSIALEEEFWKELQIIAKDYNLSIPQLITKIDAKRDVQSPLASSIRVYILSNMRERLDKRKNKT